MRLWALLVLAAVLVAGCGKDEPPDAPPRTPPSGRDAGLLLNQDSGAGWRVGDASRPDSGAVAKLITKLRDTKLELAPRRTPPQRLAFARGRLGVLTDSELVVYDTDDWGKSKRVPIEEPRQLLAASDGSFLAVGSRNLYRMAPAERTATRHPRVPLFAGSMLFADRLNPAVICVVHGFGATLYQYDFTVEGRAGLLAMSRTIPLEGYDGQAFAALNDGSFLYTAGEMLRRFFAGGRIGSHRAPDSNEDIWRLLLPHRIDRVWIARRNGTLDLVQMGPRIVKIRSLALRGMLFEITSNARFVATIRLEQPSGGPRRWSLEVFDPAGKRLLEQRLPTGRATAAGDWVARATRNKEVVLGRHAPLVAVGGPTWLKVWNVETGRLVANPLLTPDPKEPTASPADGGP
jgi:hypothetical protein